MESYELLYAKFLWINDLSQADPYYILPLVSGLSMHFQQRISTGNTGDETQRSMMYVLPIMMTVLFSQLPAGLVLYMVVNNVASIVQLAYIMKRVD